MRYLLLLWCLILSASSFSLSLRHDSPSRYVVKTGDTLWEIANRYLDHPWEWASLWRANPRIKNPNHLYPGDVILLRYDQHHPYLSVLSNGTIKLSPSMQSELLEVEIPPIPLNDIRPFLNGSLVLDKDSLSNAPYIVAFTTEHMLGGQGDEVYVKNLCPSCILPTGDTFAYAIFRPNGVYTSPVTNALLGYKATLVGYAELVRQGDPATIVLTDIIQGIKLLDRVMPNNHPDFDLNFMPRAPSKPIHGSIIDVAGDFSLGAEGLVVVLDRGNDVGIRPGDVLAVFSNAKRMKDLTTPYKCVRLPRERIGEVLVFRTFTHTSFALVVRATRAVKRLDRIANP